MITQGIAVAHDAGVPFMALTMLLLGAVALGFTAEAMFGSRKQVDTCNFIWSTVVLAVVLAVMALASRPG